MSFTLTTPTPLLAFAGPMSTPTPYLAFGTPSNVPGRRGIAGLGEIDSSSVLWIVGGGIVVLGLGWLIYRHVKRMDTIAEREGSAGLLKYHAGTAAIGIGSQLASELIGGGRYRQNKRRARSLTAAQRRARTRFRIATSLKSELHQIVKTRKDPFAVALARDELKYRNARHRRR